MFNLVNKRYLFLIISLIVIIPGAVSLIFKGLYVGIDFVGGSTLEFRPSQAITDTQPIVTTLQGLGFKDVQLNVGSNSTAGNQTAWVRLNTDIDSSVWSTVQTDLKNKYSSNATYTLDHLQVTSGGNTTTVSLITITSSKGALKASDIEAALKSIPDTTNTATATATPTPTATAGATTTPSATKTATPSATATASAQATVSAEATAVASAANGATPTPTATPSNSDATSTNPANIPVKIQSVTIGSTNDTLNILTTTATDTTSINQIKATFIEKYGNYLATLDNSSVSPSVASTTIVDSVYAVIAASVLILLYVWFAFRKVQKPWRYGACAIIALLHDVLVVLGVFSILGWTMHVQIDSLFITALLTVVGFSVHDTIVVFDRIRENMQHRSSETFEQVVNASLVQTMSRSLNTSLTVLFTLTALTLFIHNQSTQTFTGALLVGIFSGTYSSIFNASMLLVIWEKGELGLWRFDRTRNLPGNRNRRESRDREVVRSRG